LYSKYLFHVAITHCIYPTPRQHQVKDNLTFTTQIFEEKNHTACPDKIRYLSP